MQVEQFPSNFPGHMYLFVWIGRNSLSGELGYITNNLEIQVGETSHIKVERSVRETCLKGRNCKRFKRKTTNGIVYYFF